MKTQLHSTGRFLGIGMAAASATLLVSAGNHAQAAPYSGTNAINFMFAYSGEGAYTTNKGSAAGYAAVGVDPSNTGTVWNQMVPTTNKGSLALGGYGYAPATNTLTNLTDSMGNATDVAVTIPTSPASTSFENANWAGNPPLTGTWAYSYSGASGNPSVALPVEISGLTPGAQYDLYLYASNANSNSVGTTFSLAAGNQISGDPVTATTTGISSVSDPNRNQPFVLPWNVPSTAYGYAWASASATDGQIWTMLPVMADSNGDITFYHANVIGAQVDAVNGFQLQPVAATPEPATVALLGVAAGAGLLLTSRRKRAVNS